MSMNLSLFRPKKDQCDLCPQNATGNISTDEYNDHIELRNRAREEKSSDKDKGRINDKIKVITMDQQSFLVCPFLMSGSAYFRTKLTVHTFTTYNLSTQEVKCFVWHEGESGLTANTFASCITSLIEAEAMNGVKKTFSTPMAVDTRIEIQHCPMPFCALLLSMI